MTPFSQLYGDDYESNYFAAEDIIKYQFSKKQKHKLPKLLDFILQTMKDVDYNLLFAESSSEEDCEDENVLVFSSEELNPRFSICIYFDERHLKIKSILQKDDEKGETNSITFMAHRSLFQNTMTLIRDFIQKEINEEDNTKINISYLVSTASGIQNVSVKVKKVNFEGSYYPTIKNVEHLALDFFNSDSNVLLFYGAPGTGKTTFIRYLIEKFHNYFFAEEDNYYPSDRIITTNDPNVLYNDSTFLDFVNSCHPGLFIIEDADTMMKSREEGNEFMKVLLNFSDGIFTMGDKKIVLTTNLEHTNNIDDALLRPGRCFDSIHFRTLTLQESQNAFPEMKDYLTSDEYSLAELFMMKRKYFGQ